MSILQAILLGVVQGITEFFPVSSSGHLILLPEFFGWDVQSVAFDAVIHLATLGAVAFAFWPELRRIVRGMFGYTPDRSWGKLGWMLIIATIPAGAVGWFFQDTIETTLRDPRVVAASLAVWALVLLVADRMAEKRTTKTRVEKTGWRKALAIGFAQAIALIPGTSRSGITITAGLFSKMDRSTATRFSFLLGFPAIAAAGALGIYDVFSGIADIGFWPLTAGFVSAFVSGFIAIRLLLALVETRSFFPFVVYRLALAAVILLIVV